MKVNAEHEIIIGPGDYRYGCQGMKTIAGVALMFILLAALGALLLYCMAAERFGPEGAPDYV